MILSQKKIISFTCILFSSALLLAKSPIKKTEAPLSKENIVHTGDLAEEGGVWCRMVVEGKDTIPHILLRNIYVFPPVRFKNKKEEEFYWRTVRDVKKALPYAKIIAEVLAETNDTLMKIKSNKERKRYMKQLEKEIFKKYEKDMHGFTLNQGKLLIRLIDRECDQTSYSLIKAYRGGFVAGFWQGFAALFGASLKTEYSKDDKDRIIERIITLVEAGQL